MADDHETFPSALPVRREVGLGGWVTIQIGCDNSCAFCIVPAVRGKEISRPFDDIVDEVAGAGRRRRHRGHAARPERQQLRPRPHPGPAPGRRGGAGPAAVRRPARAPSAAVDGIRRVRYTSPHPKDLRPETIAAMAETPAVCEHLHLPLQSGSDRVLAAMHRGYTAERYLERLAAARAAIDDLAVTTDIIVGFPGETDDDFERTLEVAAEAAYDSAYTFIFSPRPGTEAAERVDDFVPADVVAERFERLRIVVERSALAAHQARVGPGRGGARRGPVPQGPGRPHRPHPAEQARPLRRAPPPLRPGTLRRRCRSPGPRPHHLRGELVEVTRPARHRTRIPVAVG